jgi:4'-phosphopantetheinyl transferase
MAEDSAPEEHDLRVALTWSAKESALKVLRVGLRRDTRDVEVDLEGVDEAEGWHPFEARLRPERRRLHGWWCRRKDLVLTIASNASCADPPAAIELSQSYPL